MDAKLVKEELISKETALLAKEAGYDYTILGNKWLIETMSEEAKKSYHDPVWLIEKGLGPTQSLMQKWLREEHNIFINIHTLKYGWNSKVMHTYSIRRCESKLDKYLTYRTDNYLSYEEALEHALQKTLKLLKKR